MTERRPRRIQLSRRKGFRLPAGAVNCARPGPLGNPFVIGRDGDRAYCVELQRLLMAGYVCTSKGEESVRAQLRHRAYVRDHLDDLRGKDLACWCRVDDGGPCHVDTILKLANAPRSQAA